jgi:hypothetical protein
MKIPPPFYDLGFYGCDIGIKAVLWKCKEAR